MIPDYNLEDLQMHERLAVRCINVCKQQNLSNLHQIVDYYVENGTFLGIRNSGLKTENDLVALCRKYLNKEQSFYEPEEERDILSFTIAQLQKIFAIKEATKSVLRQNNFGTAEEILIHFEKNGTFINLQGSKPAINSEIIWLAREIKLYQYKSYIANEEKEKSPSVNSNIVQNSFANQTFLNLFHLLSIRTQNVIRTVLNNEVNVDNYKKLFLYNNFFSYKLQNAGEKTLDEITQFNKKITVKLDEIAKNLVTVDQSFLKVITSLSNKNIPLEALVKYQDDFLNKRFPLFSIFKNEYVPRNVKLLYIPSIKYFVSREYMSFSKATIAEELSLTIERVRQLKEKIINPLLNFFHFEKELLPIVVEHTNYLNSNNDLIDLTKIKRNSMNNDLENVHDDFFVDCIIELLKESFSAVNNEEKQLAFLVKKELCDRFNFNNLLKVIEERMGEKLEADEYLNFEGFIYQFYAGSSLDKFDRVKEVSEYLLGSFFNVYINVDGEIEFKRNTLKPLSEIIYEIIKANGIPIHISSLINKLENKYPDKKFTESNVRGNVLRIPRVISFGRTSTYGLKEWETSNEGIKGGHIREIVIEILSNAAKPLHISQIVTLINRYRQTNEKNVITNLKLDSHKRFVIYKKEFVGLKNIRYQQEDLDKIDLFNTGANIIISILRGKEVSKQEVVRVLKNNFGFSEEEVSLWFTLNNYRIRGYLNSYA